MPKFFTARLSQATEASQQASAKAKAPGEIGRFFTHASGQTHVAYAPCRNCILCMMNQSTIGMKMAQLIDEARASENKSNNLKDLQFKRIKRNVNGVLLLDKPLGFSSNQALQKVKWLFSSRQSWPYWHARSACDWACCQFVWVRPPSLHNM